MSEIIKQARQDMRMSQADLAIQVGVSAQQVGKWERGENVPSSHRLRDLAMALALPIEALVPTETDRIRDLQHRLDEITGGPPLPSLVATVARMGDRLAELEERVAILEGAERSFESTGTGPTILTTSRGLDPRSSPQQLAEIRRAQAKAWAEASPPVADLAAEAAKAAAEVKETVAKGRRRERPAPEPNE